MRLYVDFETYYDHDYSLGRLSVEAYCRDPRLEILCCGTAVDGAAPEVLDGRYLGRLAGRIYDADEVVCHNAYFDGYIIESVLGLPVDRLLCTSAMSAWAGIGRAAGRGLASLSRALGLGAKGDALSRTLGRRRDDFDEAGYRELAAYCASDVELTRRLFDALAPAMTAEAPAPAAAVSDDLNPRAFSSLPKTRLFLAAPFSSGFPAMASAASSVASAASGSGSGAASVGSSVNSTSMTPTEAAAARAASRSAFDLYLPPRSLIGPSTIACSSGVSE